MSLLIALDAMGGDAAPAMVVDGAALALAADPELRFVLFGDEARLRPLLARHPGLRAVAEVVHTPDAVAADAKPSLALRQGRTSSMRLAIDAVKDGRVAAAVSAGNTGALMAMAKVVLRTLPGIDRPAICGVFPSRSRPVVILDLGANVACDAPTLVQFAVMGTVFARAILGIEQPTIGLLNVGTEELKGDDVVRAAAAMLKASPPPIRFGGFIEGTDLVEGSVDVVVTDGFTGNVALKIAEGVARMFRDSLKEAFTSSLRGRLGYLVAKPALVALRERFDPRRHNGAMFLGLNGVVVKSHGGTDALGFSHAIKVAADLVRQGTNARITEEMRAVRHALEPASRAAVS
ncbi:MAG: phosphate acyltransferase PlsX [Geminicoccaceae bacterium]|nr:phosphate acyltransferase PlsX [Geminicoccaceae bacterium]MCX8099803.1 phosphate acyltransferase PlsX [Geminicoccaceae bacterium]MDW8368777.1 phosphate acyltransferase PlsX [Geminicoccaceae bacterium]